MTEKRTPEQTQTQTPCVPLSDTALHVTVSIILQSTQGKNLLDSFSIEDCRRLQFKSWPSPYSKLCITHTEQYPCGTGSQTAEYLLQSCPLCKPLRKGIWPDHTSVAHKLHVSLGDLQCTATFIKETGVSIRRMTRRNHGQVLQMVL